VLIGEKNKKGETSVKIKKGQGFVACKTVTTNNIRYKAPKGRFSFILFLNPVVHRNTKQRSEKYIHTYMHTFSLSKLSHERGETFF
jgi:hypothetical protein